MAENKPLMDQYRDIKARHRDAILFFRLGDFYEMFDEDAVEASSLLNLTLTRRQDSPMCGVPYHAARSYVGRLLKLGKKIAICEQLTKPGAGKGIIERDVVEIVTPGTAIDEDYLESSVPNHLVGLGARGAELSCAYADLSSGVFAAFSFPRADTGRLRRELRALGPRELLVQQSLLDDPVLSEAVAETGCAVVNRYPDWSFDARKGFETATRHFGTATLRGFGFPDDDPALAAAGVVLAYLEDNARGALPHIDRLSRHDDEGRAIVDESAQKNLEIDRNLKDGGRAFTLLETLDRTKTAMGARELRTWLLRPLKDADAIARRHDGVEALYRRQRILSKFRDSLSRCLDLERLASRVAVDRADAKDLLGVKCSIDAGLEAFALDPALAEAGIAHGLADDELAGLRAVSDLVGRAIDDEPSAATDEGGLIKRGFDPALDAIRDLKDNSRAVLEAYVGEERAATGIQNLKVRYNRVIGYYLEVSKSSLSQVPERFSRRQSISNGERFTTDRLVELETELNDADERIADAERELFLGVRARVKEAVRALLGFARRVAVADCLASFAAVSTERAYVRPVVDESGVLEIVGGRHPVVEAHLPSGAFVRNDASLDADGISFALVTGPNMAGKSTYLRQNALIALMAQAGCFVPAESARVGAVDRIFCRVGAQDNLARGESTFLVEMHETAYILNNATSRSLVVMDEVGRGTGTVDGLSIAWAVAERLLGTIGCRALFATHYHELTELRHPKLVNRSMAVSEREGDVVFLRTVRDGPASGSYGIHVAKIAGLPAEVVARAESIRDELSGIDKRIPAELDHRPKAVDQFGLFPIEELVLDGLRSADPDRMTPIDALSFLARLKADLCGAGAGRASGKGKGGRA